MINVIGYFNPHSYKIYIEVTDISLKVELPSKAFLRNESGQKINDPIFEPFVHQKGLAREESERPVPRILVKLKPT